MGKRIGFIGLGLMGHGIAKNLRLKGHELLVLGHRNRAPVEDLVARGAREAATAKQVAAESEIAIVCVTGSPEVEDVMHRKDGLLEGVHKGLIVADASTAMPSSTIRIAAAVEAKGGRFADIPLTRTPKEAEDGKLGVMTGGDAATIAELRPIIDCFAEAVVHAGPVGAAHTLKLVNNFLSIGTAAVVAEGIVAAAKAGVDMTAFRDIVAAGGANSVMFQRLIKVALEDDDTAAKFSIANARKDMRYYTNLTETLATTSFVAEAVHQSFVMAANRGFGERYIGRLITALAELNRVTMPEK